MAGTSVLSTLNLLSSPAMRELERAAGKPLVAHASGIDGAPDEIDRIRGVLVGILPLLSYADRYLHDASVGNWVEKVRSMAQQVEDILEEHMYDAFSGVGGGLLRVVHGIGHAGGKWKTYCRTAILLESVVPMADEIHNVYNLVIANKLKGLAVVSASLSGRSFRGQDSCCEDFLLKKEGLRAKELAQMKRWLTEEPAESMVIAMCGAGGVGKTTLVREVYRDPQVIRRFECQAWVTVSRSGYLSDLLRGLAIQLNVEEEEEEEEEDPCRVMRCDSMDAEEQSASGSQILVGIRRTLQGKRYLIVFDDVWDGTLWDNIRGMFGDDRDGGGRFIITTRNKNVANSLAKEGRVLALEPLPEEEAWVLFTKRAFRLDPSSEFPHELEQMGRQVASQCEGLPLAIQAAANLMSTKERVKSVWERACKTLELRLHDCSSNNILMHSYFELPSHLKQCFLYLSIFPQGCLIKRKPLIRLWVAEGFIMDRNGRPMEEVAEAYLQELIHRNMIEVAEQNEGGRVKACRIHDDLRTLALEVSRQQKFAMFHGKETKTFDCDNNARRVSLEKVVHDKNFDYKRLRSLLLFIDGGDRRLEFSFSSKLKLLKVLELRGVAITEVPGWIFTLYNLRYLGLRETKINIDVFPREVQQLQQLQTLDLWKTEVLQLPRNIVKLQNLRHLIYCGANAADMRYCNPLWFRGREAPKGMWDMRNLQTLKTVEATSELVGQLGELTQLRTLSITKVMHEHYIPLLDSISKMRHLEHLAIKAATSKVIALENLTVAPTRLRKLLLKGSFFRAPEWFEELENLTHLYLFQSCACESPLEAIGMLPSLSLLVMDRAYKGETLFFRPKWFPKLRKLYLDDMEVRSIVVGKGALPALRMLYVGGCGSLGRDWQGVENLTALEEICLREPTRELNDFLQPICRELRVNLKEIR